jgi:hypothetical protein
MKPVRWFTLFLFAVAAAGVEAADPALTITPRMAAPEWAKLERRLLAENVPACREFAEKYYDGRGDVQGFVRWGANDAPHDAFEDFAGWPELDALGASDEIARIYLKTWEGMLRQDAEAKTSEVPAGRDGLYFKEFSAQPGGMHHGEGLKRFNLRRLSMATLPAYQARVRRFAGLYGGEDPAAPNYDVTSRLIRSMQNGSKGPILRPATALDGVGAPFDPAGFKLGHGERTDAEFRDHYRDDAEVGGDHFFNLVATVLPANDDLLTHEPHCKGWIVDYMDAWLARIAQNGGVIPSQAGRDGRVDGADGRWWSDAYGWGFSPVNPVNAQRENRNRIAHAHVGFDNALLVTGDQKYVDAWRTMTDAVNAQARTVNAQALTVDGPTAYPTMFGAKGWSGGQHTPWAVGALETGYWAQRGVERARLGPNEWVDYLEGKNPADGETALRRDLASIRRKVAMFRADDSKPEKRRADTVMDSNPAATAALVQRMWGALLLGREGRLLNARLRYFDPAQKRAGVPDDVGALVSEMSATRRVLTLVNLSATASRTVLVQGGGYGEHRIEPVEYGGGSSPVGAAAFSARLAPGAGATLTLTMTRYAHAPTVVFSGDRREIFL